MDSDCNCPVLIAAAEAERLLEFGLVPANTYGNMTPILIGRLRQERGCPGPRHGLCPWQTAAISTPITARPDVPWVGKRFERIPPRETEVPGQWL